MSKERIYYRFGKSATELLWIHRDTVRTLLTAAEKKNDCNIAHLDDLITALLQVRAEATVHVSPGTPS